MAYYEKLFFSKNDRDANEVIKKILHGVAYLQFNHSRQIVWIVQQCKKCRASHSCDDDICFGDETIIPTIHFIPKFIVKSYFGSFATRQTLVPRV